MVLLAVDQQALKYSVSKQRSELLGEQIHSKSLKSNFFFLLMHSLNFRKFSSKHLDVLAQQVAARRLADLLFLLTSTWTDVPHKIAVECI